MLQYVIIKHMLVSKIPDQSFVHSTIVRFIGQRLVGLALEFANSSGSPQRVFLHQFKLFRLITITAELPLFIIVVVIIIISGLFTAVAGYDVTGCHRCHLHSVESPPSQDVFPLSLVLCNLCCLRTALAIVQLNHWKEA